MKISSKAGDTVNGILWRELGRDDDDAEEALFALNPDLAARGPVLPAGVIITLPELANETASPSEVVTAWD